MRILTQNVASGRCSAPPPTVHLRNAVGALDHRALSYVEVESYISYPNRYVDFLLWGGCV